MPKRYGLVKTSDLHGINGMTIDIEVVISSGLPGFDIVGLADSAIRESRNRIQAAIRSSGFLFPNSRITASLAPAYLKKQGSAFDFPLALAILAASGQIKTDATRFMAFGELTLDGQIRGVPGAINRYLSLMDSENVRLLVPRACKREIGLMMNDRTIYVSSLQEAVARLNGQPYAADGRKNGQPTPEMEDDPSFDEDEPGEGLPEDIQDICDIIGQDQAVRAAIIAAAGQHNLLMLGSPGCGKTALANAMIGIMPPMTAEESLELTRIYSAAGLTDETDGMVKYRPFRAPHHTITRAAMIGGGLVAKPGEISLAHRGILFLDEMTEFNPSILNTLRQPLEDQQIQIIKNQCSFNFPAAFLLVGAANPCQCGHYFDESIDCKCRQDVIKRHFSRISGPLLDRIDLVVGVRRLDARNLERTVRANDRERPVMAEIAKMVSNSRKRQQARCLEHGVPAEWNGRIQRPSLAEFFRIPEEVIYQAAQSADRLRLSVRGYHKILRISRTIADLEEETVVAKHHLGEALQYRPYFGGAT